MHRDKLRVLLRQDKCLVLQPELVAIVGRSPALLLQQIHYWLSAKDSVGRIHEGQRWVYNTYEDWVSELKTMSRSTIHRAIAVLRKHGLISIQQFSCKRGDRTNWYTINYDKITQLMEKEEYQEQPAQNLKTEHVKMTQPSSQSETTYTETNIKNKLGNQTISEFSAKMDLQPNLIKKPSLLHQMLQIWNDKIELDHSVALTQRRSKLLRAALKHKFQNQLALWEAYCRKIASSDFLMGRITQGFKATIDWALKFDSIQRIFENQFGIKIPDDHLSPHPITETKREGADQPFKEKIKSNFGMATYLSWFQQCHIFSSDDDIVIDAPTSFHRDWIRGHFLLELEKLFGRSIQLNWQS